MTTAEGLRSASELQDTLGRLALATLLRRAADELEAKDKRIKELEAWRDQAVRFQDQINMLETYILKLEAELKAVNPAALILKTSL